VQANEAALVVELQYRMKSSRGKRSGWVTVAITTKVIVRGVLNSAKLVV
jgi:hypothetical protein